MSRRKERKLPEAETEKAEAETDRRGDGDAASFIPNEKLQAFYNDAYINERDRLNAMFGRIDTYPIVNERIVRVKPDPGEYVPIAEYRKKRRVAWVLGALCLILAIGAAALCYLFKTGVL